MRTRPLLVVALMAGMALPLPTHAALFGNELIPRTIGTDLAWNVLVVDADSPLPAGTLTAFLTYSQSDRRYAWDTGVDAFRAYVLRPTGRGNLEFTVVYSTPYLFPGRTDSIVEFPVSFSTQDGDLMAHYGRGIPFDIGNGTELTMWPVRRAPTLGQTIALGEGIFSNNREYSLAARVPEGGSTLVMALGGFLGLVALRRTLAGRT